MSPTPSPFRRLGTDYDERILPSIINEVAKAVVARFNASELITQRELVSAQVRRELEERAGRFNILLEDVAITHLTFSAEYSRAVESKQVAEQDAQRAAYIVQGAKAEKETIVTRAKGRAEATSLIGNAMKQNPAFTKLRRLDAAKEIAGSIVGGQNRVYLDAESLLLNLGVAEDQVKSKEKKWWTGYLW